MKMPNVQEECGESATCLCMITGAACLFVGSPTNLGVIMAVMASSFALPLHFFNALWVAKNGKCIETQFQKLTL